MAVVAAGGVAAGGVATGEVVESGVTAGVRAGVVLGGEAPASGVAVGGVAGVAAGGEVTAGDLVEVGLDTGVSGAGKLTPGEIAVGEVGGVVRRETENGRVRSGTVERRSVPGAPDRGVALPRPTDAGRAAGSCTEVYGGAG